MPEKAPLNNKANLQFDQFLLCKKYIIYVIYS